MANILRKVKVKAAEVKMNVVILHQNGEVYTQEILKLVDEYPEKVKVAYSQALNLSIAIDYPTKENIGYLLAKAYSSAQALEKIGGAN